MNTFLRQIAFLGSIVLGAVTAFGAASDLDPSWDTDGKLVVDLGAEEFPQDLLTDPDGKVIVAVQRNGTNDNNATARGRVMRFLANGGLDTTFAGDGVFELPLQGTEADIVTSISRQKDGKYVVVGSSKDSGSSQSVLIVRLNTEGTLDTSFDSDGVVRVNVSNLEHGLTGTNAVATARDVAFQSDGRIVVGGDMKSTAAKTIGFLMQLNAGGSLDSGFATNGIASMDVAGTGTGIIGVAVEPDGDVVFGGSSQIPGGFGLNSVSFVGRVGSGGTLDPSFNGGVIKQFKPGDIETAGNNQEADLARGLAIAPDGDIVLVGHSTTTFPNDFGFVVRLDSSGAFDSGFGGNGIVLTASTVKELTEVVVSSDGKVLVGGFNDSFHHYLTRILPNGSLDSSWAGDGDLVDASANTVSGLAIGSNGRVVTASWDNSFTNENLYFYVYLGDAVVPQTSLSPSDNVTGVVATDNLVMTFAQSVTVNSGSIEIRKAADNSVFESIPVGDARVTGGGTSTITVNPTGAFAAATKYYVSVPHDAFRAGATPSRGLFNTDWEFETAAGPPTAPEIAVTETGVGDVADGGSFSFGTTTVGTPVTKTFTVTNSGTATLNVSALTVPSGFTIAANFGSTTVAASGGTTTFQITMSAGAPATPSGMLSFDNNDADENPYNFTISGTITASSNADLSSLTTTASGLSPVFGANTLAYTATVPNATTTTTVTATRADANATLQVRVNGGSFSALTTGVASGSLALNVGPNPIDVKVTAQDGTTIKTYTITVTRAAAAVATVIYDFENVSNNAITFSSSSQTWTLTGFMRAIIATGYGSPLTGNAAPTTNGYMDTLLSTPRSLGNVGGIQAPVGLTFRAKSFDVWPSSNAGGEIYGGTDNTLGTTGLNFQVIGKLGGSIVATANVTDTVRTPAQTGTAVGGYWHHLELGAGFAATDIDTVEFVLVSQAGAAMNYLAVDNFEYSNLGVATSAPEIAVTEAGVGAVADGGSFSFGTTTVGTPVTKTFTVTNSGTANLTLSNLTVPSGFTIAANFGSTTVASGGGATTFQITMSAGAAAAPSGTLSFTNDDADENPFNFTISGMVAVPDTTPPDTTITGNPTNPSSSTSATFSFTGSDPGGSGVASFETKLDGGAFVAATSPETYTGLSEGPHTFQVRAIDNASNVDLTPASFVWTVDSVPPAAPVVVTPANGSTTTDTTPTVTGTAEPGSTISAFFDGSVFGTTTADGVGNWSVTPFIPLSVAPHTVKARTADAAGNVSVDSITNSFTIVPLTPEIAVSGNGNNIADGSNLAAASTSNATDFGSTPVQGGVVEITYMIANSGTAVLTLSGGPNFVSVTPSTDFSVTQQPAATVADSGGMTTFKIAFNPTTAATTNATVTFTNDDANEGSFDFVIKGTGTGPQTFDLVGHPVTNTPFDGGETYIYSAGPPPLVPVTFTLGGTPGDATTGSGAPDTAGTASIGQFDLLKRGGFLGDNGMVVFPGELLVGSGLPPVTSSPNTFMGLWKDDGTGLKLLARSGDPAPEAGGADFDVLPTVPAINDSGEVTFLGTLALGAGTPTTTSANETGLWSELGGTGLQILIREDDDIPSLPAGTKVDKFASGAFATADTGGGTGEAAFAMTMKGTSTDSAILRTSIMGASVTAVGVVARQNTTAPGTAQNFASLNGSYTDTIRMDAAGNLTFVALVTSPSREGIWYQSVGGATEKVFLAGDPAPSTGGATFKNIKSPAIGSGGTITFRGFLNSDGDNAANTKNDGIWRGTTAGGFTCILRRGDGGYAGMPGGSLVGNVWHGWLNNNNHGAWRAWVDVNGDGLVASTANGDVQGIFTDINGAMELAIAVGDAAPGILGATFASMDLPIVGSDAGGGVEWVVFIGKVTGGGTTPGVDDQGIWRKTDAGAFQLVIRAGDTITTSEGVKTIQKVDFPGSGGTDRRWEQPVMDNAGRLLIYVKFTDGSTSQVLAP